VGLITYRCPACLAETVLLLYDRPWLGPLCGCTVLTAGNGNGTRMILVSDSNVTDCGDYQLRVVVP
jgi:hypothetical protein